MPIQKYQGSAIVVRLISEIEYQILITLRVTSHRFGTILKGISDIIFPNFGFNWLNLYEINQTMIDNYLLKC